MAEVVDQLPPARSVPGDPKYAKYFDGQAWKLVLGVDCPANINIAQNAIRITAKRAGIKADIRQSKKDNAIYVQAHVAQSKKKPVAKKK
jgi:hypothetical protein